MCRVVPHGVGGGFGAVAAGEIFKNFITGLLFQFSGNQFLNVTDAIQKSGLDLEEVDPVDFGGGVGPHLAFFILEIGGDQIGTGLDALDRRGVIGDDALGSLFIQLPDRIQRLIEAGQQHLPAVHVAPVPRGPQRAVLAIRSNTAGGRINATEFAGNQTAHLVDLEIPDVGHAQEGFQYIQRKPGQGKELVARQLQEFPVKHLLFPAGDQELADFGAVVALRAGQSGGLHRPVAPFRAGDPLLGVREQNGDR